MIGEKIRRQRIALGLSQSQLAEGDITRAYISLIESGKRVPSQQVLFRLSLKLKKPPEYFLNTGISEEEGKSLLHQAQMLVEEGQVQSAYAVARQAFRAARQGESKTLVIDTRLQTAIILFKLNRFEFAMDHLLDTLFEAHAVNDRLRIIESYYYLGHVNYRLGHFQEAVRYYLRVVSLCRNHKTLQSRYAQSLVYLGSCLVRMERFNSAVGVYKKAHQFAGLVHLPTVRIDAGLGLGWALHENGSPEQGLKVTRETLQVSKENSGHAETELMQNAAICYFTLGSTDRAVRILNRCLKVYESNGDISGQSSVLEEKVKIALERGQLKAAEDYTYRALELIERENASDMKGQLYAHLGTVSSRMNRAEQAYAYYRLAMEHFRTSRSEKKLAWVTRLIEQGL